MLLGALDGRADSVLLPTARDPAASTRPGPHIFCTVRFALFFARVGGSFYLSVTHGQFFDLERAREKEIESREREGGGEREREREREGEREREREREREQRAEITQREKAERGHASNLVVQKKLVNTLRSSSSSSSSSIISSISSISISRDHEEAVTSLHSTSLHSTSLHSTSLHFTSLHFTRCAPTFPPRRRRRAPCRCPSRPRTLTRATTSGSTARGRRRAPPRRPRCARL